MKRMKRSKTTNLFPSVTLSVGIKPVQFKGGILLLIAFSLLLTGCAGETTPAPTHTLVPTRTVEPTPLIETRLTAEERLTIFDSVWRTVNEKFFDPTFGGVDWQAIGDAYRPQLSTVEDDGTFWFLVLNPMLFELGVSHIGALPAELANELETISFASGSLGMDVRLIDGMAVITKVIEGSPADQVGLHPGFVIHSVNDQTLSDFAAFELQVPPDNERNRRARAVGGMRAAMYGEVGTEVVIEYLDANDQTQQTTMQLAPRTDISCAQSDLSLPPFCTEFEVQHLANGIGYIRFSGFLEPALESVLGAIDDLHDAPALIIDLRGNPGGTFPVRKAIASQLVGEPELFMRYQLREGMEEAYLDPVSNAYPGEVVLLVDELSTSSSEEFAGSLQALGRATIIGSQTPGSCLVMNVELLLHDAILVYPYGQSQTPDGRILEDNGVVPDIEVALDREQLLQGIDAQLEAAIEFAQEQIGK